MARGRRLREDTAAPARRVPPPWYRDVWPWLLALGLVVLALIGGIIGYQAYQDDSESSDEPDVVTVTETTGADTTSTETGTTTAEEPPEPVTVPGVVGENYVAAGSTLEGMGLAADSYPVASQETRGTVVAQRPDPGTTAKEGDIVRNNVALSAPGLGRRGRYRTSPVLRPRTHAMKSDAPG